MSDTGSSMFLIACILVAAILAATLVIYAEIGAMLAGVG